VTGAAGVPGRQTASSALVDEGSPLFAPLAALARQARMVLFAGLPGTGKSLLIRELAHLAHARGRRVHLLQWDVAGPAFEAARGAAAIPRSTASRTG
jgi:putative protein kinase ArgK-like GTPase of G3E family